MDKIMVFGTFDILHEGHKYFLEEAKKHGYLIAVVARDKNVIKIKGKSSLNKERQRLRNLKKLKIADKVVLGYIKNPYKIIEKEKPDIMCLGYDQKYFIDGLKKWLKEKKMKIKIIRLKPYKPKKYKSSILRKEKI